MKERKKIKVIEIQTIIDFSHMVMVRWIELNQY
jgi:hypothetical protein